MTRRALVMLVCLWGCKEDPVTGNDLSMPDLSMAMAMPDLSSTDLSTVLPDLGSGDFAAAANDMMLTQATYFYIPSVTSGVVRGFRVDGNSATPLDLDAQAGLQDVLDTGTNPIAATVTPSGKFLYLPNHNDSSISGYVIDAPTGRLTRIDADAVTAGVQDFAVGVNTGPTSIAVDPLSQYLFTANADTNNVSVFSINGTSGALTPVGSPVPAGTEPRQVLFDSTGTLLFAINQTVASVVAYTVAGGTLTPVDQDVAGGVQPLFTGVDSGTIFASVHPTKRVLYVSASGANKVDALSFTAGGVLSALNSAATGASPFANAINPTGKYLYAVNYSAASVSGFSLAAADGALTALPATTSNMENRAVTFSPDGTFLYLHGDSSKLQPFSVNLGDGSLTAGPQVNVFSGSYTTGVAHFTF